MRKLLKLAVVAALAVPLAASASGTISASKHNLSTSGTNTLAKATSETQICVFCHTPHNSESTKLLWNRVTPAGSPGWTNMNTTAGTQLPPVNMLNTPTKACLTCHDGTQSVGAVRNLNGVASTIQMNTTADISNTGNIINTTYLVGGGGNMDKNHPVSIPFKGATYLAQTTSIQSKITWIDTDYRDSMITCGTTGYPVCVTGLSGTTTMRLYGSATNNAGVECGSCHEPHDGTYGRFLRANNAGSALCQACHNK